MTTSLGYVRPSGLCGLLGYHHKPLAHKMAEEEGAPEDDHLDLSPRLVAFDDALPYMGERCRRERVDADRYAPCDGDSLRREVDVSRVVRCTALASSSGHAHRALTIVWLYR